MNQDSDVCKEKRAREKQQERQKEMNQDPDAFKEKCARE